MSTATITCTTCDGRGVVENDNERSGSLWSRCPGCEGIGVVDAEPGVLSSPAWWGLGTPSQHALTWAVRIGGTPYVSDLIQLRALARQGYVVEQDGKWAATDAGREVYASRQSEAGAA